MKLKELQNKIKAIDMQSLKEQAVKEHSDEIVKLNQSQLRLGRTKDGKYIEPSYSKAYLKRKRKLSSYVAPDGIPDLFLHGDFYREMETIIEDNQYEAIEALTIENIPFYLARQIIFGSRLDHFVVNDVEYIVKEHTISEHNGNHTVDLVLKMTEKYVEGTNADYGYTGLAGTATADSTVITSDDTVHTGDET